MMRISPRRVIGTRTSDFLDHRERISDQLLYQIAARHWAVLCKDMAGTYTCLKAIMGVQDYRETIRNSFYWRTEFGALNEVLRKLNRANPELSSNHDGLSCLPDSANLQLPSNHEDSDQTVYHE